MNYQTEPSIAHNSDGEKIIVTPEIIYTSDKHKEIIHIINIFLEIFHECEVSDANLQVIFYAPIKRLNWNILPKGKLPWEKLHESIKPVLEEKNQGDQKQKINEQRVTYINKFEPEFTAIGLAGFRGYIILGFPQKNLYLLESMYTGNATYVFGEDWQYLSQLTKAQILDENLQKDRIIHRDGWDKYINQLLK